MPIQMPPSYIEYCRKFSSLTPTTMFNIRDTPVNKPIAKYEYGDTNIPGTLKGKIDLMYVLKSFPKQHDNSKYQMFVISRHSILTEEVVHSERDEPIVFRNVFLRYFKHYSPYGGLITNLPDDSRQIIFLSDVKYQEQINRKFVSNTYNFLSKSDKEKASVTQHMIYVMAPELKEPMGIPYDENLYIALKNGQTYLHLRNDNYVEWKNIVPYHPRY